MDERQVSPAQRMKRDLLKQDVRHVLTRRPDGLPVSEIWNVVFKETGRIARKHDVNVSKMSDLLDLWTDDFRIKGQKIYLKDKPAAGFSAGANYVADFPVLGAMGGAAVSRQSGGQSQGRDDDMDLETSSDSEEDDDVAIIETPKQLFDSAKVKGKTAMSVMSSLSSWGKPVQPGTSGMYARPSTSKQGGGNLTNQKRKPEKSANQKGQEDDKSNVPSFNFISLVDDDDEDKSTKSTSHIDTVDLTVDTPVRSALGQQHSPNIPMVQQQRPPFMYQGLPSLMGPAIRPFGDPRLGPPLVLNISGQPGPALSTQVFHSSTNPQGIQSLISNGPSLVAPQAPAVSSNGPADRNNMVNLTVKPIERKEFEHKEVIVHPVNIPRNRQPPREFVDTIAKECIETLAEADEFVMPERVEKLVCQRFQINNVRQIGFNHVTQIPSVYELNRLLNKIHAYVVGFIKTRSICTLHELKEAMREFVPNKEDFSKLKVGPLQRSPVVFQQFKFPPDQAEIPEISSIDVMEHFRNYLTKKNLWTSRLTLEPFMDYLVEEYNTENAYYLGVRIMSLPLAAATLKKAQRDAAGNRREVYEHYKDQLKEEIEDAFRKFRAIMLQTGDEEGMVVRKHYLKMRPDLVIMEIFEKFNLLMTVTEMGQASRGHQKKLSKVISDFVNTIKNDGFGKSIFHLAICMSSMAIEEATLALLMPKEEKTSSEQDGSGTESKPPPRKDNLIESVKNYIERCLNAGSLSLTHLDRIEEKLLEDFGFADFRLMGYGRFLQFLITESKTKQTLEEGGGLVLGSSSSGDKDATFKPHQADIQEFIKQCKLCGLTQPEEIENALCKHYGVKEARYLGYGNITRLLGQADKHKAGSYSDFTVFYQSTLTKPTGSPQGSGQKVGVLGHQTRDLAKACLHNCPLLEDLAAWSQWGLVFEPELGKLKDFTQKYGGFTNKTLEGGRLATLDFLALETKPGVLLKIVSNTSAELVAAALEKRDVYTFCGHLVSMVVAYKGVHNLPKALLAGHIKTALLQLHATDPRADTPGAPSTFLNQNSACQFVLQCLLRIPTKVCVDLADDLFLSPLGQVVGSTKFKQLLVQLCTSVYELNGLTELGCLLGIQEWTNSISQKCVLSESSIQSITPDVEELFVEEQQGKDNEEEDSSDSSDESDTEDLEEILVGDSSIDIKSETDAGEGPSTTANTGRDGNDDDVEIIDVSKKNDDDDDDDVKILEELTTDVKLMDDDDDVIIEEEVVKERTCEDIIKEIQKEEFGVGVHLSDDAQRLMKIQQQRLGRSLDRLSKDLYSKDTHFVLELVQNADDNSYHDDLLNYVKDTCPSVKFVIDKESVCVRNNEMGFQEGNIRALCDVGRSTKGKHKFGYIGQKGIGFKSVYRVTDTPEIHSSGFHVKFDVNSGPMGYILPHWSPQCDRVDDSWTTNIILTLKPDMRLQTRTLAARFNDIHPSLLLFLHRLREITIENKVEDSVQSMRRRDVGENIIEIQHTGGLDRWLIMKKMLDASQISSQAKSGADVESTEIAIAFPLKPAGQKLNTQRLPPKQLVFAFLPLRSYGFRFIVQGDFDVPSSREDVDRDSSWNQWLRNEIHTLFLDSLEMFKGHREYSNIEAVISFLQFVPMEDEVLDFFKPVASDILKKLRAKQCVPTQPDSQGAISWKIPSQTVRVRDPLVRSVITADLLQAHLNLHYLHPDVASMLNPTLTSCLGIETLTSEHLFHLGKALIVKMGDSASRENVLLIARWLACMYRSLDEFQEDDAILTTLKSLTMLPLSDGKLVSLQEDTVFYPIPNSQSVQKGKDPLYYLQQDVNSLHPLLLKTDDDEVNSQVHKLLLRLGIKQLSPFDVINHHIIPVLKSGSWKSKSTNTVVSYIIYVKEQTEKQTNVCNLEELKDIAQIVTNKGIKNPNTEPVHFSSYYGNSVNLQKTFPGYDWTVVDPVYLPAKSSHLTALSWHDFFVKLGVEDFFSVQKREMCLKKEQLASSPWKQECEFWPQGEWEYVIQDFYCEELESLITLNTQGALYQDQMRALCLCLEKLWDSQFSRYTKTSVCDKHGKTLKETHTSFSILLKSSSWLPAIVCHCVGEPDGSVSLSRTVEIGEPNSLYVRSEMLERLVSDKVPYLDVNLALNSSFHQFLDLKINVTIETVKGYLLEWSGRSDPNVPTVFCTSLSHMKEVYSYLSKQLNRGDLQDLLLKHPVFFVPTNLSGSDVVVSAKMLNKSEIWLADKTGLFDKHRGLLEEFHSDICKKRTINSFYCDTPELISVFKQDGRIDQQPQIEEYIELLSLLCTSSTPKDLAVLSDVLHIFTTIGHIVSHPPDAPNDHTAEMMLESTKSIVRKKMRKEKVLPTKKGIWVSLADKPLIADNRDWEKMFVNKEKVHFLDLEDKLGLSKQRKTGKYGRSRTKGAEGHIQADLIDEFIEVCEVKKLSDCVKIEVNPVQIQPCVKLQLYFHRIVPVVQQYLAVKYEEVYRDLEQRNTKQMLKDAIFYQTGQLEVIYRLNILEDDTFEIREEKCVIHPPNFYFHDNHVNSIQEVNKEIARHFSGGNNGCNNALRGFLLELHHVLSTPDMEDSTEALLQRFDADVADIMEEEVWQVAPPALPEPEPEPEPIEEFPMGAFTGSNRSGNKDEPFEMRAWPPVASEDRTKPKEKSDLPTSNIWPPPQAKDYMRTLKDLPSNIRMAGPGEEKTGNQGDQTTDSQGTSTEGQTHPSTGGTDVSRSSGGEGHQTGSHGNSGVSDASVTTGGVGNDINKQSSDLPTRRGKRKLSENVDDVENTKRHSSEFKGENTEGRPAEGQAERTDAKTVPREAGPTQEGDQPRHEQSDHVKHDRQPRSPAKQTQSTIRGEPVWSHMASEYTYDELGSGQELPDTLTLLDSAGDPEIGRWGENLVACYLERQKEAGNIIDFEWHNHDNETGAPYDFLVHFADETGIHEDFIEVKSTVSDDKEVFEISVQQIKFAEEKKGNFHIYRVFNAGDPEKVRLIRIFDLDLRLSQKQVKLCMLI